MDKITFAELEAEFGADQARRIVECLEIAARYVDQAERLGLPMEKRLELVLKEMAA